MPANPYEAPGEPSDDKPPGRNWGVIVVIAMIVSMLVVSLFIGCTQEVATARQDAPAPAETVTESPELENATEGVTGPDMGQVVEQVVEQRRTERITTCRHRVARSDITH